MELCKLSLWTMPTYNGYINMKSSISSFYMILSDAHKHWAISKKETLCGLYTLSKIFWSNCNIHKWFDCEWQTNPHSPIPPPPPKVHLFNSSLSKSNPLTSNFNISFLTLRPLLSNTLSTYICNLNNGLCSRRLKAVVDFSMVMRALLGGILQTNYTFLNLFLFHFLY